ncbi:hypothetical protein BP6252_06424 [Coleophoma cylindrospora]|uniref:Uncharacterized protein n=1 Tax=Coleophoma cylindrospora TaxID=1849047 RepID=A0A3D8RMH3_9HELO|nr:hypothetical protein BP6252_06424 [Coleophoma cylindrospora]
MESAPVWFITGCSTGFGGTLALIALRAGHRVIATSRNPSKTPDLISQIESLGGKFMTFDVCSPEIGKVLDEATAIYGRIDILVNNAGYALLGAFEVLSENECRAQMETNFFAPVNIIRHVLPAMRKRKSGIIVNISSTAGLEARPTRSMYSGSKWALEAVSEALYEEVKPLGIRVIIVQPGAFQTPFSSSANISDRPLPDEYDGTSVAQMIALMKDMAERGLNMPGDVNKGAQIIFDYVMKTGSAENIEQFLRLPLGKDGSARWEIKLDWLRKNLDGTEALWKSTDTDP